METNKNISSGVYPQILATTQKVYVPQNIKEINKNLDNGVNYIEYLYDEDEYSIEEYIISLKETNDTQDNVIDTTLLATDEIFNLIEPLLEAMPQILNLRSVSKMVDMYVVMVQRGLKTIEQVPKRYREQVKEILAQLEN